MTKLTRDLVIKKAREIFPGCDPADVLAILDMYGKAAHEPECERVQLAALKLSEGKLDRLRQMIVLAKEDFRDVIAPAEYPEYEALGVVGLEKLDAEGCRKLQERDLRQYLRWLLGEG